jgi:hypothetical protein
MESKLWFVEFESENNSDSSLIAIWRSSFDWDIFDWDIFDWDVFGWDVFSWDVFGWGKFGKSLSVSSSKTISSSKIEAKRCGWYSKAGLASLSLPGPRLTYTHKT